MSHLYSINGSIRRQPYSVQSVSSIPNQHYKRGSIIKFDDGLTYIRRCKLLKALGLWWLPTDILEGVIENPIGNEDTPTFIDTVVDFLESEETSSKLAKNFNTDIYSMYESVSMSLDALQDIVDIQLVKTFGDIYFNNYKVVRWLDTSTAIIGVNQIDPIR